MSAGLSRRDRTVAAVGGVIMLYALAVVLWFTSQEQAWRVAGNKYRNQIKKVVREKKVISERERWNSLYEAEKEKMPVFGAEAQDVDTHWLSRMDALAQNCNVGISQRQAGEQVEAGDVFELPIDVRRWEATITSLVKFMHALENEKEAMFDVREISVKPSSRKGFLTGSFKLACAYMRGEEE